MTPQVRNGSEDRNGELEVTAPGGFGARAKGYRMMDLVCLLTAAGVIALAYYVKSYAGEYEKTAQSIKDSNSQVVETFKNGSKENADAIRQLTMEIRRGNEFQRETACLLDPSMKGRIDAREICKRLGRDRDHR